MTTYKFINNLRIHTPLRPFSFFDKRLKPIHDRRGIFVFFSINSSFDFLLGVQPECPSQRERLPSQPVLSPTHWHPTPAHCTIIHSPCGPNREGLPRKGHALKVPQIHSQLVMRNHKWERRSKRMCPLKHPHPPPLPPLRIRSNNNPTERREPFSKKKGRQTFFYRHSLVCNPFQ